eukprot:1233555-Amphidinium_carterae.1
MWITCGKIPASYVQDSTDPRHRYYNFHREVHYATADFINLYLYNMLTEYARTAAQFTMAIRTTTSWVFTLRKDY